MMANAKTIGVVEKSDSSRKRHAAEEQVAPRETPEVAAPEPVVTITAASAEAASSNAAAPVTDPKKILADAISRFDEFEML